MEWPTKVAIAVGTDIDVTGEFWCTALVATGDLESFATKRWEVEERTAPIESVEAAAVIDGLATDVRDATRAALDDLVSSKQLGS